MLSDFIEKRTNTNHERNEPAAMIAEYFNPTIYPNPNTIAEIFSFATSLNLSESISPNENIRVVMTSDHVPNALKIKSNKPPIKPEVITLLPGLPLFSRNKNFCCRSCFGKRKFPVISFTKYFLKGIRNKMPRNPPSNDARNI